MKEYVLLPCFVSRCEENADGDVNGIVRVDSSSEVFGPPSGKIMTTDLCEVPTQE
jgi:hypothetical protein